MKLFGELIGKSPDQTPVTRFLSSNGLIYIVVGVIMVAWPGSMQTVFGEIDFVGRESGLIQVLGLTVAIIGVLYLLGGRGHSKQVIAVSVLCRPVLVPATIIPLANGGVFPGLLYTFVALDVGLSLIMLVIYRRHERGS